MATKFDIFNGFVEDQQVAAAKATNKERIAPEIAGARRFWFNVMAPAIASAKKSVKAGKDWKSAKSDLVHEIRNACENRKEYLHVEYSIWEEALERAEKAKAERERRREASRLENLARREAAAVAKRARQAALAARELEKRMTSVDSIAVAIGWTVDTVSEAIKAIKNGIKNATVRAYKEALKSARRERLNNASMFTAIGDLIDDAQAYVMHIIGLINESTASDSVAY